MNLDFFETHDRLLQFKKQSDNISQGVVECIKNVPDSITCPFYVYGHSRTVENDEKVSILKLGEKRVPDTRIIWMPVVTKPKAAPNTYLFLSRKNSDVIEIIWMIPKKELWDQYAPGKLCHNENIWVSIQNFIHHRDKLNAPDKNGPTERDVEFFRRTIGHEAEAKKAQKSQDELMKRLYG